METPRTPIKSILKLTPRITTGRSTNFIDGFRLRRRGDIGGFENDTTCGNLTGVDAPGTNNQIGELRTSRVTFFHKDDVTVFNKNSIIQPSSPSGCFEISSSSMDDTKQSGSDISHVSNSEDEGGAEAEGASVSPIRENICIEKDSRSTFQNAQVVQAGLQTPETLRQSSEAGRFMEEGLGRGDGDELDQDPEQVEVFATPNRMIELPKDPPPIHRRLRELSRPHQLPLETPKRRRTYQEKVIPRSKAKTKDFSFGIFGSLSTPKRSRDLVRELMSQNNKSMTTTSNGGVRSSSSPLANRNGSRGAGVNYDVTKQLPPAGTTNTAGMTPFKTAWKRSSISRNSNFTNLQRGTTRVLVEGKTGHPSGKPSTSTAAKTNNTIRSPAPQPNVIPGTPTTITRASINEIQTATTPIRQAVIAEVPESRQEENNFLGNWTPSSTAFPSSSLSPLVSRFLTPARGMGTLGMGSALRRSICVDTMHNSPGFPVGQANNRAVLIKPTEFIISSSEDEDQLEDGSTCDETKSYDEREDEEEMELYEPSVIDLCSSTSGSGRSSPDFFEPSMHQSYEEIFANTLKRNTIYSFPDTSDEPLTSPDKNFEGTRTAANSSDNMASNSNASQSQTPVRPQEKVSSRQRESHVSVQGSAPNPPIYTPVVLENETAPSSSRTERVLVTPRSGAPSVIPRAPKTNMLYKEIKEKLQNAPDKSDMYLYLDFRFDLMTELCKLTDQEWKKIEKKFEQYFGLVYIETVNNCRSNMMYKF